MRAFKILSTVFLALLIPIPVSAQAKFDVHVIDKLLPANHPEIVYWFWQHNTLENQQYLRDVDKMAASSPYSIAFFTARDGVNFYDFKAMHEPFAQTVREAHAHGLKIGLQLWDYGNPFNTEIPTDGRPVPAGSHLSKDQAIALVTEGQVTLDARGHAEYSASCVNARNNSPFHSELLKVYAFHETSEGFYPKDSLIDLTSLVKSTSIDASQVKVTINAPAKLKGCTAYIMVAHYYNAPDLFNNVMIDFYRDALQHYADIPFDGTALDEFGYLLVTLDKGQPFRDRFYGRSFADAYRKRTGTLMARGLFDMRFAPEGKPEVRMRAINEYFDLLREGPMRVEQAFYEMSKKIFGPDTFAGDHDTFHNYMRTDDLWRTGFNWWQIPREYGQSDENWPMPQRMGLIAVHPEPIAIDMFYSRSMNAFVQKAFRDARFDGRIDYHAWNDNSGRWGIDLADTQKYAAITDAEMKIRLLNHFKPAAPKLSVLVMFGMPALINWYPDEAARNPWDINGSLGIEQKALDIWKADYPCALLPSDFIDEGKVSMDAENRPVINGHTFDCLVFLYPQYAKPTTLRFLEQYAQAGGKLMLEGNATRDFDGNDISARFQKTADIATVRGFDIDQLAKLQAKKNPLADGAFMEDGSVIFTDYPSWHKKEGKPFTIKLAGHEFTGKYEGVCAIKADQDGNLEKFVCGGFTQLSRDGQLLFSLPKSADVVIERRSGGDYEVTEVRP
ncbi:MAG TPA: hypothetical protein VGG19_06930 [Tepidisphaeraceae bacterium]|jgi:hypothetical protein